MKASKDVTQRHRAPRLHEKVAVSVPSTLLTAARKKVEEGEARSLSAVFATALERELERDDAFERLVDQMVQRGELTITDEDRAWAKQVLAR